MGKSIWRLPLASNVSLMSAIFIHRQVSPPRGRPSPPAARAAYLRKRMTGDDRLSAWFRRDHSINLSQYNEWLRQRPR